MIRLLTNLSISGPWFLFMWYLERLCSPDATGNNEWLIAVFLALAVLGACIGLIWRKSWTSWPPVKLKVLATCCFLIPAGIMVLNPEGLLMMAGFFFGLTFFLRSSTFIQVAVSMALAVLFSGLISFFNIQSLLQYLYLAVTVIFISGIWLSRFDQNFVFRNEAISRPVKASWVEVLRGIVLFSLIFWAFNFIIWQHIVIQNHENKGYHAVVLSMVTCILFPLAYLLAKKIKSENAPAYTFWVSLLWMVSGGYAAYTYELSWIIMFTMTVTLSGLVSGFILNSPYINLYTTSQRYHILMGMAAVLIHLWWVYMDYNFKEKLDVMKMPEHFHLLSMGQLMLKQINVFPALIVIASGILFVRHQNQMKTLSA